MYNPRNIVVTRLPNGRELLTGMFRDDGVREDTETRSPDRPFGIAIPLGFDAWQSLNTRIFYALKSAKRGIDISIV
jgi:hypothetical protein